MIRLGREEKKYRKCRVGFARSKDEKRIADVQKTVFLHAAVYESGS